MERRKVERLKQRLTCELVMGDRRHPGIVLDVSPTGLFVQTSASPPPGERVRVKLRCPGRAEVEVVASVARRYVVPRRLVSVAQRRCLRHTDTSRERHWSFKEAPA